MARTQKNLLKDASVFATIRFLLRQKSREAYLQEVAVAIGLHTDSMIKFSNNLYSQKLICQPYKKTPNILNRTFIKIEPEKVCEFIIDKYKLDISSVDKKKFVSDFVDLLLIWDAEFQIEEQKANKRIDFTFEDWLGLIFFSELLKMKFRYSTKTLQQINDVRADVVITNGYVVLLLIIFAIFSSKSLISKMKEFYKKVSAPVTYSLDDLPKQFKQSS